MGGSSSKSGGPKLYSATTEKVGEVELLAEICSSWGYNSKVSKIESLVIASLNKQGYDVTFTAQGMPGGNNEYNLFRIESKSGLRRNIFSNNKKLYSGAAVLGMGITTSNADDVVTAILTK